MKKLLSVFLATAMLFLTVIPMVSAEEASTAVVNDIAISATEKTVIRMEDYKTFEHTLNDGTVKQSDAPVVTVTKDGAEYKILRTGGMSPGSIEQTFRLTAEKTGVYDIAYIMANVGHLSKPIVKVNGGDIILYKAKSLESSTGSTPGYFGDVNYLGAQENTFSLYLQAGEAVPMTLILDMSNTGNQNLAFALDDFTITPKATQETVSFGADGMTFEMENYINHGELADKADTEYNESIYMMPASTANDGSLYSLTELKCGANVNIKIPVNVESAGVYDIEMISNYKSGEWMSGIDVQTADRQMCLSNTGTYRTADLSAPATAGGKPTYFDSNYPAGKFNGKVFLNKGQQDIVVTLKQREADSAICAKIDYIELSPRAVTPVALDKTAETKIEFEQYNDAFDTKGSVKTLENVPGNQASGGSYLYWDTGHRTHDVFGDILVTAPENGFYDIKFVSTSVSGSTPSLYVDGEKAMVSVSSIFDTKDSATGIYSYFGVAHFGARNVTGSIYLTKGNHWLTASISRRDNTTEKIWDVAGLLDYMTITPDRAPAFNVAEEGTSTLQFEDYVNYTALDNKTRVTGSAKSYAKGTVLDLTEKIAADGIYLNIPVQVAESGLYDVKAILSASAGTWTSMVTVSLDGEAVIINNKDYLLEDISKAEDGTVDYVSGDYAMGIYGGGERYLEAGEHTLSLYAKKRSEQTSADKNAGRYVATTIIDSFSLTRLEDSASIDGKNVNATVYFNEVYEGKIITALYAGKQMVGISVNDIADDTASTTTSFTETPDTVKVFVWKDLETVEPLVEEKIITLK